MCVAILVVVVVVVFLAGFVFVSMFINGLYMYVCTYVHNVCLWWLMYGYIAIYVTNIPCSTRGRWWTSAT